MSWVWEPLDLSGGFETFEDDFTTNTKSEYSGGGSYNSSSNAIYFNTGDNNSAQITRTFDRLPETGHLRARVRITGDDPYGESTRIYLDDGKDGTVNNQYSFHVRDSEYTDHISKHVDGTTTDSWSQTGSSKHSRFPIDFWWSPTRLKGAADGNVRWDVTTSDTTAITPNRLRISFHQIDVYWEYIMIEESSWV